MLLHSSGAKPERVSLKTNPIVASGSELCYDMDMNVESFVFVQLT